LGTIGADRASRRHRPLKLSRHPQGREGDLDAARRNPRRRRGVFGRGMSLEETCREAARAGFRLHLVPVVP